MDHYLRKPQDPFRRFLVDMRTLRLRASQRIQETDVGGTASFAWAKQPSQPYVPDAHGPSYGGGSGVSNP